MTPSSPNEIGKILYTKIYIFLGIDCVSMTRGCAFQFFPPWVVTRFAQRSLKHHTRELISHHTPPPPTPLGTTPSSAWHPPHSPSFLPHYEEWTHRSLGGRHLHLLPINSALSAAWCRRQARRHFQFKAHPQIRKLFASPPSKKRDNHLLLPFHLHRRNSRKPFPTANAIELQGIRFCFPGSDGIPSHSLPYPQNLRHPHFTAPTKNEFVSSPSPPNPQPKLPHPAGNIPLKTSASTGAARHNSSQALSIDG